MSFIKKRIGGTRKELLAKLASKRAYVRFQLATGWKLYVVSPLDYGWEYQHPIDLDIVAPIHAAAREHAGWDGSFVHQPVLFSNPGDGGFACGIAWKQCHAGVSFVASPARGPKPYADDDSCVHKVVEFNLTASLVSVRSN